MSISNYSELQTAVKNWSHRADLDAIIPDFIRIAELKLYDRLRIRAMENVETGEVAAQVALPTGFLEMISLTVTSGGTTWPLAYTSPNNITSQTGSPSVYSIVGENFYILPVGTGMTYTLTYYKPLDSVVDTANWLITNAPDVYLFASMIELCDYVKDRESMAVYVSRLEESINRLTVKDRNDRYGSGLVVRVA